MSRGKRGTCNYKMMTFRIRLDNWDFIHNGINAIEKPGQYINRLIDEEKQKYGWNAKEEIDPKQTQLDFNENKMD